MNSYERYMAVIEHAPCDILPRLPILMALAANHIGATYGEFAADYRVLVKANEHCVRDFGFDQLSAISDPYRETTGFGGEVEFLSMESPFDHKPTRDSKDFGRLKRPILRAPAPEGSPGRCRAFGRTVQRGVFHFGLGRRTRCGGSGSAGRDELSL